MPKREGVKRIVLGAILFFLVAPAIFVLAVVIGVRQAIDAIDDAPLLKPGQTTTLDAGESVSLFIYEGQTSEGDGATAGTDVQPPAATCEVTDPAGQPVALTQSNGASVSTSGKKFTQGYEFTAAAAGPHKVTCGTSEVLVMDSEFASDIGKSVGATVLLGLFIPFVVGMTGLVLFIWGLVKYRRYKRGQQPQFGGYGQPGYPQPGYPQPGYPQGPGQPQGYAAPGQPQGYGSGIPPQQGDQSQGGYYRSPYGAQDAPVQDTPPPNATPDSTPDGEQPPSDPYAPPPPPR